MKKGAIFDMDGLIFDTERLYRAGWTEMAGRFGQVHNPAFIPAIGGTSTANSLEIIHSFYPEVDPEAFRDTCLRWVDEQFVAEGFPEKPGVRELMTFLRARGVKIAVASSNDRAPLLRNLRHAGLEGFLSAVVSGEEVVHSKPAPDIFQKAAEQLGLAPEECYVFEDSVNGARAGIAAGCATVMVPDLIQPPEEVRASCAGVCPSLLEAKRAIEEGLL